MITVDEERCVGCGICEQLCPVSILRLVDEKVEIDESRVDECVGCKNCEISCPVGCILVQRELVEALTMEV